MIAELTLGRLVPGDDRAAPRTWVVAAAAALRALTVGLSVLLLACGLALILWASAPESTAGAASAVRAGVVAFAAAHLVPVNLGGVGVTLSPLLITGAVVGLLAAVTRRARLRPVGRTQEVVAVVSTAAVHGLFVSVVTRSFAPAGTVPPTAVLTAGALALLAAGWGTAAPGSSVRHWWSGTPVWLRLGCRAGAAAAIALLAAGALAVVAGLVLSFSSVAALTGLTAPGVGAGLGLTVVQLLVLPNAAVAGTGYVTGVGFDLGAGHYSPLGSTAVDLPAIPIFAAAPEGVAASGAGLVWLVVPVGVAVLVGWWVAQRTVETRARFAAVGTAAVVAGGGLALIALIARGGVQGGPIAATGAPAALLGGVVAAGTALIGGLTLLALHASARSPEPSAGRGVASGTSTERSRESASVSRAGRRGRVPAAGVVVAVSPDRPGTPEADDSTEPASTPDDTDSTDLPDSPQDADLDSAVPETAPPTGHAGGPAAVPAGVAPTGGEPTDEAPTDGDPTDGEPTDGVPAGATGGAGMPVDTGQLDEVPADVPTDALPPQPDTRMHHGNAREG